MKYLQQAWDATARPPAEPYLAPATAATAIEDAE
jgi:hypothetical protein